MGIKKAGSKLSRPAVSGPEIAFCDRTSNSEPAGMNIRNYTIPIRYSYSIRILSYASIYCCFVLVTRFEFLRFETAKSKAQINALFQYVLTVLHLVSDGQFMSAGQGL
mgnify:CR=1 FL=1